MRVLLCNQYRQNTTGSACISECIVFRKIKFLRECHEITFLNSTHGIDKFAQPLRCLVQFIKRMFISFADFILVLTGAQTIFKVAPEFIEPVVHHLQYAAEIAWLELIQTKLCRSE